MPDRLMSGFRCAPTQRAVMTDPNALPLPHVARDFAARHIGPSPQEIQQMLDAVGAGSMETLIAETLPESIRILKPLSSMGRALSEVEALARLRELASKNTVFTSLIGQGYSGTLTPLLKRLQALGLRQLALTLQSPASLPAQGPAPASRLAARHSARTGSSRETAIARAAPASRPRRSTAAPCSRRGRFRL